MKGYRLPSDGKEHNCIESDASDISEIVDEGEMNGQFICNSSKEGLAYLIQAIRAYCFLSGILFEDIVAKGTKDFNTQLESLTPEELSTILSRKTSKKGKAK
jgi:hypothetical protein